MTFIERRIPNHPHIDVWDITFWISLVFWGCFPLRWCPSWHIYEMTISLKDCIFILLALAMLVGGRVRLFHPICYWVIAFLFYATASTLWSDHSTIARTSAMIYTAVLSCCTCTIACGLVSRRDNEGTVRFLYSLALAMFAFALCYFSTPLWYAPASKRIDVMFFSFLQLRLEGPLIHCASAHMFLIPLFGYMIGRYLKSKSWRLLLSICATVLIIHCLNSRGAWLCLLVFFCLVTVFSRGKQNRFQLVKVMALSLFVMISFNFCTNSMIASMKNNTSQQIGNTKQPIGSVTATPSAVTPSAVTPSAVMKTDKDRRLNHTRVPQTSSGLTLLMPTARFKETFFLSTLKKSERTTDMMSSLRLLKERVDSSKFHTIFFGSGLTSVWPLKALVEDARKTKTLNTLWRIQKSGFFPGPGNGLSFYVLELGLVGLGLLAVGFGLFVNALIQCYRSSDTVTFFLGLGLFSTPLGLMGVEPFFQSPNLALLYWIMIFAFMKLSRVNGLNHEDTDAGSKESNRVQ